MKKSFFVFLLLTGAFLQSEAQKVSRKIVLDKDEKLESIVTMTMNMSQEMMGQQMEVKSNTKGTSLVEVKDVAGGNIVLLNTMKRMVLNTTMMGQEMNYDSDKPEDREGQLGEAIKGRIGVAHQFILDKQGRIKEFKDTSSAGNDMMGTIMGNGFVEGAIFPLLSVLPEKTVKVGDSWVDSSSAPGSFRQVNSYTLKQVTGNDVLIDVKGQMTKTGKMEQQGMEINMNIAAASTGQSVYDLKTGILKKNNTTMKISGTMDVMGQSVPITMNSTTETVVNKL